MPEVEPHGLNAREFSLMAKNGLAPAQVLMAGTANGADLLGIADQTGTLTAGKLRTSWRSPAIP
jgi:imidazolonepropionase-like amidohydrolase